MPARKVDSIENIRDRLVQEALQPLEEDKLKAVKANNSLAYIVTNSQIDLVNWILTECLPQEA